MEKSINTFEIRRLLGRIVGRVPANGERLVGQRQGEPAAATADVASNERRTRGFESLFVKLERAQVETNLSPAEADALAREAIRAVRSDHLR